MNIIHELYCDFIDSDRPKLLIDTRKSSTRMTETEQKIWGTYAASRKEQANALVAVIYNKGHELNPIAIERSKQAGRIVEIFYNESDAIKWLCQQ
ncbi:hypothetical protein [Neptunicella sp. SCSIO 80796]|uniref:hypothetical protein n=1 Tax=Neptunicella plasticusilytica TaxID=3117012 RepID=UPI003A4E1E84